MRYPSSLLAQKTVAFGAFILFRQRGLCSLTMPTDSRECTL
jgi:hypothetical protein